MNDHVFKFFVFIILCLFSRLISLSEDLVITKLNPSPIKIGNKTLTKGGTFSDADIIYWSSENQDMKAMPKNGGLPRHFSAAAFKSRSKKKLSVKQYYNKTNHPSTLGIAMDLHESESKDNFLPEKRIALVIGNSLYQYMPDLDCPISDAEDVSDQLSELGFDTYTLYDVNHEDFINALKKFRGAAQSYDVALVYYCGHGNQNDGMNYLLPINAKNDKPDDIELWISFDFIFQKMAETECKSKILFLNACRNTPGWKKAETGSRLDRYDTNGSLVVYSTSNGEVALAGDEEMRNTPFTASFLANVAKPADNISQTIQSISTDLRERTRYLEDYGDSPQQVYTFGIGVVDFTFNLDEQVPLKENITYFTKEREFLHYDNKLYAVIDGKEYQVELPDSICIDIVDQDDYDNDGHKDALIMNLQACGGNLIGNSFFFISYKGDGYFSESNSFGYNVWGDPIIELWNKKKTVVIYDSNIGMTYDPENLIKERYELRQGQAILVEHSRKNSITALLEIKPSDFHYGKEEETLMLNYDLDDNGLTDCIYCTFWDRWNLINFELQLNGQIIEREHNVGVSRIGVLPSKTNGFNDIICNEDDIIIWNGDHYDFDVLFHNDDESEDEIKGEQ